MTATEDQAPAITDRAIESLVRHLMERRPALAARITEATFADPFWTERFPTRGRRFSEEDAQYHVGYLCQAIVARDPGVFERYLLWLRGVLVARGMCTQHLAENVERLAGAIADEPVPGARDAAALLSRAIAALGHASTAARELAATADALAMRGAADERREQRLLLSYLGDALAADRGELFTQHARWLATATRTRPAAAPSLVDVLASLRVAIAEHDVLSPSTRAAATELLVRTCDVLTADRRQEATS